MGANMDTVGTFEIAEAFAKQKMITCLHKHYTPKEVIEWGNRVGKPVLNNVSLAAGVGDHDYKKVVEICKNLGDIKFLCLDVANGYQTSFIDRVKFYRDAFPDKILIAGNVVTQEIT